MLPHHEAWLAAHPERSVEWLRRQILDGFDVHHMDGDHGNNDPLNLVLIDHIDHMRLHSMPNSDRLRRMSIGQCRKPRLGKKAKRAKRIAEKVAVVMAEAQQAVAEAVAKF